MHYFHQLIASLTTALTLSTLLFNPKCHAIVIPSSPLSPPHSLAHRDPFPLPQSPHTTLSKRGKVPSVSYVVRLIQRGNQMVFTQDGSEFSKISIFWTSWSRQARVSGYLAAKTFGKEKAGDHAVLYAQSLTPEDYVFFHQGVVGKTPPDTAAEEKLKLQVLSAAFSRMSSGTVYLLLEDEGEFWDSTVWKQFEEPCLTRTSAVNEIRLVRWPSRRESIHWQRARGDGPVGVWPPRGFDVDIFDSEFF